MTTRRTRAGKEHIVEDETRTEAPDPKLPGRLYATNQYPSRRLNVYSTLEYLQVVRDVLEAEHNPERGWLTEQRGQTDPNMVVMLKGNK